MTASMMKIQRQLFWVLACDGSITPTGEQLSLYVPRQPLKTVHLHQLQVSRQQSVAAHNLSLSSAFNLHLQPEDQQRPRRRSRAGKRRRSAFRPRLRSVSARSYSTGRFDRLTSRIPGTKQIDAAGEETSFENTQDDTETCQLAPVVDKAHSEHDESPGDGDEG